MKLKANNLIFFEFIIQSSPLGTIYFKNLDEDSSKYICRRWSNVEGSDE